MRHEQDRALIIAENGLQRLSGRDVHVVRRLIQNEKIRTSFKDFRKDKPCLLSPGEVPHLRPKTVAVKQKPRENPADLLPLQNGELSVKPVENALFGVKGGRHLVEIADVDVFARFQLSLPRRQKPCRSLDKRGLAGAVRAEDADLLPPADPQGQLPQGVAIPDLQILALEDVFAAGAQRCNFSAVEHGVILIRLLHALHAVQDLLPRPCEGGLARLVFEFLNQGVQALNLLLLRFIRFQLPLHAPLLLLPVGGIVSRIARKLPVLHLVDNLCRLVQEIPVVRHHDDGMRVAADPLLQPLRRLHVQVVRRLVQNQHLRRQQEETDEKDLHLLTPGELTQLLRPVLQRKAKLREHPVKLRAVFAALPAEAFLLRKPLRQHLIRHRLHRLPRMLYRRLPKLRHRKGTCAEQPGIRMLLIRIQAVLPRDHRQERAFAGAVFPDDGNLLRSADFKCKVIQNHVPSAGDGSVPDFQQHGST